MWCNCGHLHGLSDKSMGCPVSTTKLWVPSVAVWAVTIWSAHTYSMISWHCSCGLSSGPALIEVRGGFKFGLFLSSVFSSLPGTISIIASTPSDKLTFRSIPNSTVTWTMQSFFGKRCVSQHVSFLHWNPRRPFSVNFLDWVYLFL